jgi:hypothetical protein
MALTFSQLEQILTPQAGTIKVTGSQFQTPAIDALFGKFFAGGALELSAATSTSDPAKQQVTITGNLLAGTLLNLKQATVSSGVWTLLVDGTVTVALQIKVNDAKWTLPQSFDVLKGSIFDKMACKDAIFTLDSTAPDVLPDDFRSSFGYDADLPLVTQRLVKGLSLATSVTFSDEIARDFAALFKTPMAVQGPIEVDFVTDPNTNAVRPFPQLLLNTTSSSGLTKKVGNYTFTFEFQAACLFQEFPNDDGTDVALIPTALLAVRATFAPPGTTPIPISAYLYSTGGGRLIFNVGDPPLDSIKKDQLPGLLNGADVSSLLDPGQGFPIWDFVSLENASLAIGLQPLALESITIAVALGEGKNWQLFGDLVTIQKIVFQVSVTNTDGSFKPEAAIYASAYLANNKNIQLSGYVTLPDLTFGCELVETVPIDLTSAVKNLIGGAINLPSITGSTFKISGNVKTSTYTLEALIQEKWTIFGTPEKGLTLGNIYLKLVYVKATGEGGSSVSGSVYGVITLAGANVLLSAGYETSGGWTFTGQTAPGQSINLTNLLTELASLFGITIPPGLPEVDLDQLKVEYNTQSKEFDLVATIRAPAASFNLTDLPLVGKHLDPADTISLQSVTLAVSKDAEGTTIQLTLLVGLGTGDSIEIKIPIAGKPDSAVPTPEEGNSEMETAYLVAGEPAETRALALAGAAAPAAPAVYPTAGSGIWIPIQRTFGPVQIQKIGFTLEGRGLGIQFNASLSLSVLNIDILGLEMIIPLKAPYTPSFDIHGLAVTYSGGALTISGALLKVDAPYLKFDGYLIVKASSFSLSAFGSYATTDPPSFFFFAMLNVPIGGPPAFFVTGLAGGFGYNRDLKLPSVDKVASFPLVAGAAPGPSNPFGANPDFQKFIEVMESSMGVLIGEDWLAAGIRFTTFKTLDSFALLTVAFGRRLQIGLLGLSTLTIPPDDPEPVAMAQLALVALFTPDIGEFSLSAQLTSNSYVLSKDCQLTGGFAFYLWFHPSPHAGEFVVTLGGYNPYFQQPDYYPKVPTLGFNWKLKDSPLVIKGGMYLALTPHAVMVGGFLQATWESGPIKAWFSINADFLVQWKPFHYDIRVGVNFGVKATVKLLFATVTISVSIGANLHIWGPEFSGLAEIDLSVISFTIPFGAGSSQKPKPIPWTEFKQSFLPPTSSKVTSPSQMAETGLANASVTPTDSIIKILIQGGLLKDLTQDNSALVNYVVDPQKFSMLIQSSIPAKSGTINGNSIMDQWSSDSWSSDFGVGPMQVSQQDFTSNYAITVKYKGTDYDRLLVTVASGAVPKALWHYDPQLDKSLNDPMTISGVVQGVTVVPRVDTPKYSLPISVAALLAEDELSRTWQWGDDVAPSTDPWGGDDPWTELTQTIDAGPATEARQAIIADLLANNFSLSALVDTAPLTHRDALNMLDPVVLNHLGENKAKGSPQP